MSNRKSIQILRGSSVYDPSTSEEILLNGQPFYSKKTGKLYIGDGISPLSQLKGTKIGLPLNNGEGINSLIQDTFENDLKNPQINENGFGSIAFGGFRGDKSESTPVTSLPSFDNDKTIPIDNYSRYTSDTTTYIEGIQSMSVGCGNRSYGNWNFVFGKDNIAFGKTTLVFGNGNIGGNPNTNDEYAFSLTAGTSLRGTGRASITFGENSINSGDCSITVGNGIKNTGSYSAIFGGNAVSSSLPFRIYNEGSNNLIFGRTNLSSKHNNVVLLGDSLHSTNDNQVIVGANSGDPGTGKTTLRFAVGTGTDFGNAGNGFEVYEGGQVRVYAKPTTTYDVVRLEDLNNLNIIGSTNDSVILNTHNNNINTGSLSVIGGEKVNNEGSHNFIFGTNINNTGSRSILFGVRDHGYTRITNNGTNNILMGAGLNNNSFSQVTLIGHNLSAKNDYCTIVGANDANPSNSSYKLRFAVGTGSITNNTRALGLEVYENGIVRVSRAPTYDTEVARLKEIKDLETNIDIKYSKVMKLINGLTDSQIEALNDFAKNLVSEGV